MEITVQANTGNPPAADVLKTGAPLDLDIDDLYQGEELDVAKIFTHFVRDGKYVVGVFCLP
jgi:hypothetical protein